MPHECTEEQLYGYIREEVTHGRIMIRMCQSAHEPLCGYRASNY